MVVSVSLITHSFVPRGHYTKVTILKRYFRTMMWLGRADCGWNINSDRELGNAVLLVELLTKTNSIKRLQTLDELINFMVGRSDNLHIFDLLKIMQDRQLTTLGDIMNVATRELLKKAIASETYGQQRIRSQVMTSFPDAPEKVAPPEISSCSVSALSSTRSCSRRSSSIPSSIKAKKVQRFYSYRARCHGYVWETETIPLLAAELDTVSIQCEPEGGPIVYESL